MTRGSARDAFLDSSAAVEAFLQEEATRRANEEAVARYLSSKRHTWRPNTVRLRTIQLRKLAQYLAPTPLTEAGEDDLIAWYDQLDGAAESVGGYVSAARGFYRYLVVRARVRRDDPSIVLEAPRKPVGQPRPILQRDYELALACALADPQMYAWLGLMGCCGLRCCEVAWLRSIDVEEREDGSGLLHVTGKGGKQRVVPAGTHVVATLRPFVRANPGGTVFTRPSDGQPHNAKGVSQRTNEFLAEIGVTATAHQLRHKFGTDYHAIDADMYRQAKLMGHSSVDTTQIYTALNPTEATRYVEQLTRRQLSETIARVGRHPGGDR
ncbi:tyrosine recombinase XerC [Pseudonocardia sp. ICBG601]|uniref:site-specific integrase n=1 Tax=Pseudonocardia sp. ICBG601 TaxID=2846759 RepID=UPI001CF63299|nr:tyrosine-type recombinase/integrase [Pseudonocardia sp. ICBG601]